MNLSGDTLTSSGDLVIDPTGGGVKIGTGTPGSIDLAGDDLYVTGDLEVDGTSYLAGVNASSLTMSGNIDMQNNLILNFGAAGTDFTDTGGLTLAGDLRLNNNQILNSDGTATIILNQTIGNTPATVAKNTLDAGNWLIQNTTPPNIHKAALIVDQQMSEDIFTASASGTPKFVISYDGNVGIGTTAPVQKLHVEGQCVTGDTELAIFEDHGSQFTVHKTRIKDIKPGAKVYSLNEKTGKLEPAKINRLLDMGVKPVFRLKTESGKEIRTTGNQFLRSSHFSETNQETGAT